MKSKLQFFVSVSVIALIVTGCGGGSTSSGTTSPSIAADTTPPNVSFSASEISVESGDTATVYVSASDNVGITSGPTVTCNNGGQFSGSTFTAPNAPYDDDTTCTATVFDAAGNSRNATIAINIVAPVEITLSKTQVFESELFYLEKINPPGDAEFTQLSGADAIEFSADSPTRTLFRAPSLDFDGTEQLSYEVKVTGPNGETASTVISAPNVIGRAGAGIPVAIYEPGLSLEREAGVSSNRSNILATRQSKDSSNSDKFEVIIIGGSATSYPSPDYEDETTYLVEGVFNDINYVAVNALARTLNIAGITVLNKVDDTLEWLRIESTDDGALGYVEADSLSIQDPCFVKGVGNTDQETILVGQENNGFSLIELEPTPLTTRPVTGFNERLLLNIGGGRSLCYLFPTVLPRNIKFPSGGFNFSDFSDLITLDYKSKEMVLFADPQDDQTYEEVGIIPLQTNTTKTLQIVDVYAFGSRSSVPRSLVVLLTDGEDDGVHRLINITQDPNNDQAIGQKTYSWSGGVPVALVAGNFGGTDDGRPFTEDLVVISNSDQSLFFENNSIDQIGVAQIDYAEPIPFETLPGAGSAVSVDQRQRLPATFIDIEDVLVSYPDTGELRYYTPDPTLPKFQQPLDN